MLRRKLTRIELHIDDLAEFKQIQQQNNHNTDNNINDTYKPITNKTTKNIHERIGLTAQQQPNNNNNQ